MSGPFGGLTCGFSHVGTVDSVVAIVHAHSKDCCCGRHNKKLPDGKTEVVWVAAAPTAA